MRLADCLLALSLGLVAALASGCSSNNTLELAESMPPDFQISLSVLEAAEPPVDYVLKIDRGGDLHYDVSVRAPRRSKSDGTVSLDDAQVRSLWDAVHAAGFDTLADEYTAGDGAEDGAVGLRTFYVHADGRDKRVEVRRVAVPALADLQKAILSVTPKSVFTGRYGGDGPKARSETFVADEERRRFHRSDCELCKEISPTKRRTFETHFEALDYGFDPCSKCQPLRSQ